MPDKTITLIAPDGREYVIDAANHAEYNNLVFGQGYRVNEDTSKAALIKESKK